MAAVRFLLDALHQQVRKQIELKAVSAGIEVRADDPSRLRLAEALQQYADDQKLLKRSKKTLAAHRITVASFLKSCNRTFLDQVDRRDLLRYADSLRKGGLFGAHDSHPLDRLVDDPEVSRHSGVTERGDTPRYTEREPETYTQAELDTLFAACKPEYHALFTFYLRTGFRMQEVMYLEYHDLDFKHRSVSVTAKPAYGFRPKSWEERTIPLEEGLARALEARCSVGKRKGTFSSSPRGPASRMANIGWLSRELRSAQGWMKVGSGCTSSERQRPRLGYAAGSISGRCSRCLVTKTWQALCAI